MADRKRMKKDFDSLFSGDPKKREKLSAFSEKAAEVNKKRAAERKAKAAKRKSKMDEITSTLESRKAARKSATSKPSRPNPNPRARASRGARAASAGSSSQAAASRGTGKAQPRFGVGKEFTIRGGKANVRKDQLEKTGLTQAEYMKQWRASGKRPTAKAKSVPRVVAKAPGLTGKVKSILLGKDQKFGGDRGLIDFLPGKSRKKPVKKAGGGMMKKKGMSKGGAMKKKGMSKGGAMKKKGMAMGGAMKKKGMAMGGAMKKKGMAMGGAMKKKGMSKGGAAKKFPDLTGDGKVTQADILKGRGVTKKKGGGMAKKGYAKGGMAKKGYAKGGPVRSKMSAKGGKRGGASRKPRGVGVALRGYGKALKK